jgi:hypothetical protein
MDQRLNGISDKNGQNQDKTQIQKIGFSLLGQRLYHDDSLQLITSLNYYGLKEWIVILITIENANIQIKCVNVMNLFHIDNPSRSADNR